MIYDLFANVAILTAFLFVIGQVFKRYAFSKRLSIKIQIVLGVVYSLLGILLMIYSIEATDTVIIDLRNLAIICAAIIGGPLSAVISAIGIAIFRIAYYGINTASIIAMVVAIIVGMACSTISRYKISRIKKLISMLLLSMVVSSFALIYLIKDQHKLIVILAYYWPLYIIGGLLSFLALEYLISANTSSRTMAYYRLMADNLLDMISTHNSKGILKYVSPSVAQLLKYTSEELLEININDLVHRDDVEIIRKTYASFKGAVNRDTQVYRMKRKDGVYIWVETSFKAIKSNEGTLREVICATRDVTARKMFEEELNKAKINAEKAASTDYLTGVLNRRAFVNRLNEEIIRSEREKLPISIILADIDHFKKINDSFGHQAGDLALQEFSQCLSRVCRPYDFLGRLGGEEFIICLPNTVCDEAMIVAERMRKSVEEFLVEIEDESLKLTASFGVTSVQTGKKESTDIIIMRADEAMYKAKDNGRNTVCMV